MTARNKAGKSPGRQKRRQFPEEFRAEAVKLAERIGVTAAASELGVIVASRRRSSELI